MEKVREMNQIIFRKNLLMTINEIIGDISVNEEDIRFNIIPVYEQGKPLKAPDDIMRLIMLSEKNMGNRLLTLAETVKLVAWHMPFVPVWINISMNRKENGILIFDFETSLRLRKPSQLGNVNTGHAPFKAIIRNQVF